MKNINLAIQFFGSQVNMAKALNVRPQVVYQWTKRGVPAKRAKQISEASNGALKVEDLL